MWFLVKIIEWLDSATTAVYDAYQEVSGWVWPFSLLYLPLYYLYRAFYYITYYFGQFNEWLTWAAGRIDAILGTWDIWSYFKTWFDYAANAWTWVANALGNVWVIVESWWSSTRLVVLAWIDERVSVVRALIDQANTWLANLQAYWDSIVAKIPTWDAVGAWWSNWPGNVLSIITAWWTSAMVEVQGLINSAFLERESFWAGWQDFRDEVAEFFSNPLEFLLKRFVDWFLGPEE